MKKAQVGKDYKKMVELWTISVKRRKEVNNDRSFNFLTALAIPAAFKLNQANLAKLMLTRIDAHPLKTSFPYLNYFKFLSKQNKIKEQELSDHITHMKQQKIGRAVQQECRDRSRMPSSA
eukprot:TRINITY_DN34423_c0_g2_i3.p1 TRINITY_DN34423_c0_g2~~TRINITY_DN34423_c0_g2_i3.p1  ORF type:complete len:120 (-),score=13.55 TRINITY_DN34423_c0_g2_i3:19-378(-)